VTQWAIPDARAGILAPTTGYVYSVTEYVKQRLEVVLLQEQGRPLLVGLLQRQERAPLQRQGQVLLQGLVSSPV